MEQPKLPACIGGLALPDPMPGVCKTCGGLILFTNQTFRAPTAQEVGALQQSPHWLLIEPAMRHYRRQRKARDARWN